MATKVSLDATIKKRGRAREKTENSTNVKASSTNFFSFCSSNFRSYDVISAEVKQEYPGEGEKHPLCFTLFCLLRRSPTTSQQKPQAMKEGLLEP